MASRSKAWLVFSPNPVGLLREKEAAVGEATAGGAGAAAAAGGAGAAAGLIGTAAAAGGAAAGGEGAAAGAVGELALFGRDWTGGGDWSSWWLVQLVTGPAGGWC